MPTPFIMPKFDMDQETATVVEWLKKEGDPVEIDETVLVVETDKVAVDVPAPASGILSGIKVNPGDVVPVTTVIATILTAGETAAGLPEELEIRMTDSAMKSEPKSGESKSNATPIGTPVAQRMAHELGIDLSDVPTKNDRIKKADIERFLANSEAGSSKPATLVTTRVLVPATPAARRIARELGLDLEKITGSGPRKRVQAVDVQSTAEQYLPNQALESSPAARPSKRIPLAGIRRTIAERMQYSFHTAPHIALTIEVDVDRLEQTRVRLNALARESDPLDEIGKITITALLIRIAGWALARHPLVNASLIEEEIYLWQDVNIGVATAIDDGLIVPVIRKTHTLSVGEINSQLRELTNKARSGQLSLEDVQGGTFTISNLGMYGIQNFRAIINPPESAILAVGQVRRKPVVVGDTDKVEIRPMMSLTLSADHRVIDGVVAARFLSDIAKAIENPDLLLL